MENVPLKEFLELKIAYEAAKIAHVRELMVKDGETLKLQANEYERRLDSLNHEAQKLSSMQATYIPREVHDAEISQLKKENAEGKEWRANREGRESKQFWVSVIAVIISIVLALTKFKI